MGNHAIFDPAALDVPAINERFLAQQDENPRRCRSSATTRSRSSPRPFNPLDAQGWHGTCAWCASTGGTSAPDEPPLPPPPRLTPPSWRAGSWSAPCRAPSRAIPVRFGCPSTTATMTDEVLFLPRQGTSSAGTTSSGAWSPSTRRLHPRPHPKRLRRGPAMPRRSPTRGGGDARYRDALAVGEICEKAETVNMSQLAAPVHQRQIKNFP